eukprot:320646-Amorphochlora_amoeboformis.AAC.1
MGHFRGFGLEGSPSPFRDGQHSREESSGSVFRPMRKGIHPSPQRYPGSKKRAHHVPKGGVARSSPGGPVVGSRQRNRGTLCVSVMSREIDRSKSSNKSLRSDTICGLRGFRTRCDVTFCHTFDPMAIRRQQKGRFGWRSDAWIKTNAAHTYIRMTFLWSKSHVALSERDYIQHSKRNPGFAGKGKRKPGFGGGVNVQVLGGKTLEKVYSTARKTGQLRLSGRGIVEIPPEGDCRTSQTDL